MFAGVLSLAAMANADVKMPAIFGDHMVLQQGRDLPFWGTADAGEQVTVTAGGRSATTTADAAGKWQLRLERLAPTTDAVEVRVQGKNTLVFSDVLVGEVWLCSGQSNMEFGLTGAHNAAVDLPNVNHPAMRYFKVERSTALEPQTDCKGQWLACTPDVAKHLYAVGYYFGRDLQAARGGAVGLIMSAWGGTTAQAWTSLPTLQSHPQLESYAKTYAEILSNREELTAKFERELADWQEPHAKWKAEYDAAPAEQRGAIKRREPRRPVSPLSSQETPSLPYNAMIAPIARYGIQGVIWYQGESNASDYVHYRTLFPVMIRDWRQAWGQGDFPFLFVQLANYMAPQTQPSEGGWANIREAQATALALPNTAMAVAIDVGQADDIHPRNKKDVGARLAKAALRIAYNQDVQHSGPRYQSMNVEGNKLRLRFTEIGSGLTIAAAPATQPGMAPAQPASSLKGFAIAGSDRKFAWAQARIDGDTVVVWSDEVAEPVAVRYGWASNPSVNLYNKDGFPASPFRSDSWE
jgi:sialate O-acetylesterase